MVLSVPEKPGPDYFAVEIKWHCSLCGFEQSIEVKSSHTKNNLPLICKNNY